MRYLMDLSPRELKQAVSDGLPLFAAAGTMELHGAHLPLGTDLYITEGIVREIGRRTPVIIAPPFPFCPTGYAVSGPEDGTVDLSVSCFIRYAGEILQSYERMGFRKIYVLVHHQAQNIAALLKTVVLEYSLYRAKDALGDGWWSKKIPGAGKSAVEIVPAALDTNAFPGHGGKGETEAMLALYPEKVRMENADPDEYFWTRDVLQANAAQAETRMKELVDAWIGKINGTVRKEQS